MKKLLIPLLLLCFVIGFAQTTYHFDRMLTYQHTDHLNPKKNNEIVYLTNSADNSYFIRLDQLKNGNYKLYFRHYDYTSTKMQVSKMALKNGDFRANCDSTYVYQNPFKYQTKNHDFTSVKDTTINSTAYKYYSISHKNPKKAKRKKAGRLMYVVDTTYQNLPVFILDTPYEEWKLERNVPNGVLQEYHFYDYKKEHAITEALISYEIVHKTLFIPDCTAKTTTTTSTRVINTRH